MVFSFSRFRLCFLSFNKMLKMDPEALERKGRGLGEDYYSNHGYLAPLLDFIYEGPKVNSHAQKNDSYPLAPTIKHHKEYVWPTTTDPPFPASILVIVVAVQQQWQQLWLGWR